VRKAHRAADLVSALRNPALLHASPRETSSVCLPIPDRLLAESLQLLTADVQSLAQSTKELRESTKELRESTEELRESTKELRESAKEHDKILRGHASLIGDLVRIAAGHEQRMQRLEGHQG
jgi:methyl-accepting chemotaxis protein